MPFQPNYDVPPERKPYTLVAATPPGNGRVGCLMLHGFMGSPYSSRAMAEYLHAHGVTMHCPLLPGHGHWPDKLHNVPHRLWLAEAEEALARARELCDELFIIGHSMGAILGAHLITRFGDIRGMMMLTPLYAVSDDRLRLMPLARYVMPWIYPHKFRRLQGLLRQRLLDFDPTLDLDAPETQALIPAMTRLPTSGLAEMVRMVRLGRKLWPRLRAPALIFKGGDDPAVKPGSIQQLFALLPGKEKRLQEFPEAGHELMRPFEPVHTQVWRQILEFFQQYSELAFRPR